MLKYRLANLYKLELHEITFLVHNISDKNYVFLSKGWGFGFEPPITPPPPPPVRTRLDIPLLYAVFNWLNRWISLFCFRPGVFIILYQHFLQPYRDEDRSKTNQNKPSGQGVNLLAPIFNKGIKPSAAHYSVYQKECYSQKIFFINMKFVQKVYGFDTISKRNKCSFCCFLNFYFLLLLIKSYATFCAMTQNPFCATFCIYRRNCHEGFKQ